MARNISFTIKYWKQNGPQDQGHFDTHEMKNIPDDTSFLEMLDILNEELIDAGEEPFVFDHDCREGICGMCSLYINGTPHGKTERGATTCQLYMRRFNDGDVITVEPWRSAGFPVIKDCMVDRTAFDKIIQAGGYTSIRTGQAQDANAILISKEAADEAMDCATCIGCGACVAACKNGSAMLFVSSKVSQLALLPQGRVEAAKRAKNMVAKMDELGFGNCTNTGACQAECPKSISIAHIARLKSDAAAPLVGPEDILITADTMVFLENDRLGKPRDEADALRMLTELAGNRHTVCTGVTVRQGGKAEAFTVSTDVYFRPCAEEELRAYIATGEPMDKAGAYGVQSLGALLVERIDGDFFNVMGLPVEQLGLVLARFGVKLL